MKAAAPRGTGCIEWRPLATMAGPLSGVTVVELAGIGPAPFACMMLADMGAQIIRVDRLPSMKNSALDMLTRNDGIVDRGRRSIALDMKDPRAIEIVLKLVARADILIEGFRPGVTEKLGLGPDACRAHNLKLVYGRMTGWGQTGPLSRAAGHDINYISLSGALHAMGAADRPPAPPLNLVGDYGGGGMLLALGVVSALFESQRSGLGQVVDAAMTDGAAILMATIFGLHAKGGWQNARESNFLDGAAHFYGTYECADGKFISVGAIEPQFYGRFIELCGIDDPQFRRQWEAADWPSLKTKLAEIFLGRTRDDWCEVFEGSDACVAPVLDMTEAPLHPHNVARQTFVDFGGAMQPAPAPRFCRTRSELPPPAPVVGSDSMQLLKEAGYGEAESAEIVRLGVVFQARPDEAPVHGSQAVS